MRSEEHKNPTLREAEPGAQEPKPEDTQDLVEAGEDRASVLALEVPQESQGRKPSKKKLTSSRKSFEYKRNSFQDRNNDLGTKYPEKTAEFDLERHKNTVQGVNRSLRETQSRGDGCRRLQMELVKVDTS